MLGIRKQANTDLLLKEDGKYGTSRCPCTRIITALCATQALGIGIEPLVLHRSNSRFHYKVG
jgi:hypothetical protein